MEIYKNLLQEEILNLNQKLNVQCNKVSECSNKQCTHYSYHDYSKEHCDIPCNFIQGAICHKPAPSTTKCPHCGGELVIVVK